MGVNGRAAAQTMLGFGTWRSGHCLEAVWAAYSRNGAQDLTGQSEPTAYAAWLHTDLEDRRTGTPYDQIPAGVPVYFGPKTSSAAGDIVISLGGGMCVATDIPGHPGVIGRMSIAARQQQIQRPYLGWSTTILDYPIAVDQVAVDQVAGNTSSSTPATGGGSTSTDWDEMATKEEIRSVVLGALASRPDAKIISYSGAGRNGIYLAAPGHWHQFTAEEWKQFEDHGLRSGIGDLIPVNDRDFDVLKAIYAPTTQPAPAVLTDAQLAQILAQVNATTNADLDDADLDRIAKAVRAQFAADPLTFTTTGS